LWTVSPEAGYILGSRKSNQYILKEQLCFFILFFTM
jgi:hypothetical protein